MRARRVPIAVAACLAFVVSLQTAAVVRAVEPTFGDAALTGSFDKDVVATQQVTLETRPDRIEVLATIADSPGPFVDEVRPPSDTGSQTLTYKIAPDVGTFLPNTPIRVRWRITTDGVSVVGPESRIVLKDERFDWQTVSGEVVRVHWYEGDRAFGERALRIGEQAIKDASELLGVHEEQPVDFFIYADQDAFYKALGPGTRENVGGQANADIRTLFAHIPPSSIDDPWVENVVPHELVHLVFDSAVKNPYHFPPRWLNEGLAVYLSVGYDAGDRSTVEGAARDGTLVPLSGLTGEFPTSADGFSQAYAESVSAIDFLVRTHSRDALVKLIRSYADGRTDDEAFEAAIDMDTEAFDQAWLADLKAVAPTKYGPKPAPPGPAPAAWGGSLTADQGEPVVPAPFTVSSRTVLLALLLVVILLGSALLLARRGGGQDRSGPRPRSVPGP